MGAPEKEDVTKDKMEEDKPVSDTPKDAKKEAPQKDKDAKKKKDEKEEDLVSRTPNRFSFPELVLDNRFSCIGGYKRSMMV